MGFKKPAAEKLPDNTSIIGLRTPRLTLSNPPEEPHRQMEESSDDEPLITRLDKRRRLDITGNHSNTKSCDLPDTPKVDVGESSKVPSKDMAKDVERETFSWALPSYYVDRIDKTNARVSVPGLVRESVPLDEVHPDVSFDLLKNVFIPLHQDLYRADADPAPLLSVTNFNTMSTLIIRQLGYDQLNNTTMNEFDVFFSAIDQWRVGVSGRQQYQLMRSPKELSEVTAAIAEYVCRPGWKGTMNEEVE